MGFLYTLHDQSKHNRSHDLQQAAARCVSALAAQLAGAGLAQVAITVISDSSFDVFHVHLFTVYTTFTVR
jgi:hypothetical protein